MDKQRKLTAAATALSAVALGCLVLATTLIGKALSVDENKTAGLLGSLGKLF